MKLEAERFFKQEMRNPQKKSRYNSFRSIWYDLTGHSILLLLSKHFPSNVTSYNKRSSNHPAEISPDSSEDTYWVSLRNVVLSQLRCFLTASSQPLQHLWTLSHTQPEFKALWIGKMLLHLSHKFHTFSEKLSQSSILFAFLPIHSFIEKIFFIFKFLCSNIEKQSHRQKMMIKYKQQ